MSVYRVISFFFGLISIQTLFSVPFLNWELATGSQSISGVVIGLSFCLLGVFIAWRYHQTLVDWGQRLAGILMTVPLSQWLCWCVLFGLVLRMVWIFTFPAPFRSDGATYFTLARRLMETGIYQDTRGEYAYWPPGYPLFLWVNFFVLGVHAWVPIAANLLLFSLSLPLVYQLAKCVGEESVARFAMLILTLWPDYIASAGLASKEMYLAFLLPLALLLYFSSFSPSGRKLSGLYLFATGCVLGLASLTQPSLLLCPGVLLLYELFCWRRLSFFLSRMGILVISVGLTILPWTIRNYTVFGQWIPIATNGGDVFYRANNPLATGGYLSSGERSLEGLDEVERAQVGFQLGKEWILANPWSFGALALRKQILFLGDDSQGVYETLKRGLGIRDSRYLLLKAFSNFYWWGLWVLIVAMLWSCRNSPLLDSPKVSLLLLIFIYFLAIDSVFESGARHHAPLMGLVAALAALLVGSANNRE